MFYNEDNRNYVMSDLYSYIEIFYINWKYIYISIFFTAHDFFIKLL